jgi:hypothetical protein
MDEKKTRTTLDNRVLKEGKKIRIEKTMCDRNLEK